jgi:hypothetical protein
MCRLERKDMVNFFMIILPFGVTAIAGTIRAGYGWVLLLWLAYSLFFFFVWEARVLCRHCPSWAEESTISPAQSGHTSGLGGRRVSAGEIGHRPASAGA